MLDSFWTKGPSILNTENHRMLSGQRRQQVERQKEENKEDIVGNRCPAEARIPLQSSGSTATEQSEMTYVCPKTYLYGLPYYVELLRYQKRMYMLFALLCLLLALYFAMKTKK